MKFYQLVALVASLVATLVVVELIRRRRIQHVLWLPWLGATLVPGLLAAWVHPWAALAHFLGIMYEPLLLVALAAVIAFAMLLYLTVVVSSLIQKNLRLAQELALLRSRLEEIAPPSAPTPELGRPEGQ